MNNFKFAVSKRYSPKGIPLINFRLSYIGLILCLFCTSISLISKAQNLDYLLASTLEEGEQIETVTKLCYVADSIASIYQGNPIEFAIYALDIAKRRSYREQLGLAYFTMGRVKQLVFHEDEIAGMYYDSAIALLKNFGDGTIYRTIYGRALIEKSLLMEKKIGLGGIRKQYYEAIKVLETGDELGKTIAIEQRIQLLYWSGQQKEAFNKWKELVNYYRKQKNVKRHLYALNRVIFESIRSDTVGLSILLEEMITISKRHNLHFFLGQAYFNKGRWYYDQRDFTRSLENLLLAGQEYQRSNSDAMGRAYVAAFAAFNYEQLGDKRMANKYWHSSISQAYNHTHRPPVYWILSQAAEFFKRNNMLDSALYYNEQHLKLINKQLAERDLLINELEELHQGKIALSQNEMLKSEVEHQELLIRGSMLIGVLLLAATFIFYRAQKSIQREKAKLDVINQKLNESVRLRERLMSVLAHDVLGPLNNISNLGSLKKYIMDPSELNALENKIFSSVGTTIKLLNDILIWSADQMNHAHNITITKTTVFQIVDDIYKIYKTMAEEKGLTLTVEPMPDLIETIETDSSILHLVLRNLVSNAIKFTKSGGVIIRYGAHLDGQIKFEVIDTGIGIQEQKIKSIFMGDTTGKKSHGTNKESGFGLGLPLCASYLEKLNSELQVKKNPDSDGSIFYFIIDRCIVESLVPINK